MASIGSRVYSSDYNTTQIKVRRVLGDGYPYGPGTNNPDYGYGITLLSSPVTNIRELNTSTIIATASTGSVVLSLGSIVGFKVGKTVKIDGGLPESTTITAVNTATKSITISNPTTGIISTGSLVSIYYNSNILITQQQWQNLEDDINKINIHQTNASFPGYGAVTGKITLSNLSNLNTLIDNLTSSRNVTNAAQLTQDPFVVEKTVPYTWGSGNSGIQSIVGVIFNSSNDMQYFFNSGGEISFSGEGPNLVSPQDTSWFNFLIQLSARFTRTEFARIGPIPLQWYQIQDGHAPYNVNTITIVAQKFTNYIRFTITFQDRHVSLGGSPADYVSPGAGFKVFQTRATGAFTGIQPATITASNFSTV
jgi:hypothetical protein